MKTPMAFAVVSLFAGSLATVSVRAQVPPLHHYKITDLGAVGATPGQPFHLASNGFIAGALTRDGGVEHAVVWSERLGNQPLDLGTFSGGINSIAFGVNRWGQVTGESDTNTPDPNGEDFCGFAALGLTSSGTTCLPAIWQGGAIHKLPTLTAANGIHGNNGVANVINSWDQVAGLAENTTFDTTCATQDTATGWTQKLQQKPVLWEFGFIHELPTVGGDPDGAALANSDTGFVAGGSGICGPFDPLNFLNLQFTHAILWDHGRAIDLGNLGGSFGNVAFGVNNRGDAAGGSDVTDDTATLGFLWTKESGRMHPLAPAGTDIISTALALNDSRQVVGVSVDENFNTKAAIWTAGMSSATDLNTLIPSSSGLYLVLACGINEDGQIIGLAVDTSGVAHGYLASPSGEGLDHEDLEHGAMGPIKLPEYVREQLRKQLPFGKRHKAY
ncbi:MAG: hypothetical protein ABI380_13465 [Edaphobacter sp.]